MTVEQLAERAKTIPWFTGEASRWVQDALAALASAPAGDGVDEAARRMYEDRPYKIDSAHQAQVTGLPMGAAVTWDDLTKAGYDMSEWYRLSHAALARPRAAVGEQSIAERAAAIVKDGYCCETCGVFFLATEGHPEPECHRPSWDGASEDQKIAAILALQSPPAKVEG